MTEQRSARWLVIKGVLIGALAVVLGACIVDYVLFKYKVSITLIAMAQQMDAIKREANREANHMVDKQ